ncbi:phosphoribosyltransferase [Martelella radicis]|uniref:Adenine/guanine phosphoribosyltransferase-like PRPP-binding protein n=1 Tax=Martelella radicis TaxID=1397476 RepID=A0A7W6KKL7_9HYPH|nr:phosphoribosyltransferase [Martelella radicis]MBB4122986.1 adenine/guanine phosphoribosyltransferase-like PRPP-binding protein [Martelella radicis]
MQPYDFWQEILPPRTHDPHAPLATAYPATLADGQQLLLPIRMVDEGGLASLIINQASFSVCDALAKDLATRLAAARPDIIVGLPTLGLTLAAGVARALGHARFVPLGNFRKFWYEDALSMPMNSVTTPDQDKRLFIDPRMLPLLTGKRVALVDDVISSGRSIIAGLSLLEKCGIRPVAIGAAMLQTMKHRALLEDFEPGLSGNIHACFSTPFLQRGEGGKWHEKPGV